MKKRKNLYIFSYIICIIIISVLNLLSTTDVLDKRLNFKLTSNPLLFLLVDGIILIILMNKLKKEPYCLQQEVLKYFKTTNNLFLFIILIVFGSFLMVPINLIINYFLIVFLRPLSRNTEQINGVEEYFKKHPEKAYHKFYHNQEEVKEDYKALKEEIEVEIPILDIEIRKSKKEKRYKLVTTLIPILIILIVFVGIIFSIIENLKTFSRAQYNYFEITINDQVINTYYNEEYHKVIIPRIYEQYESNSFLSNKQETTMDNYLTKTDKYLIELQEYECINDKKARVSCNTEALVENRKKTSSTTSKMEIYFEEKEVYKGQFQKDITKYLIENGTYKIIIKNKKDYINTEIRFNLSINELEIDD